MPRDSPLPLCDVKHAKIEFHNSPITILYKYMLYFITKVILGIFYNNAIAGVPTPGTYSLYNYIINAHPLFQVIN